MNNKDVRQFIEEKKTQQIFDSVRWAMGQRQVDCKFPEDCIRSMFEFSIKENKTMPPEYYERIKDATIRTAKLFKIPQSGLKNTFCTQEETFGALNAIFPDLEYNALEDKFGIFAAAAIYMLDLFDKYNLLDKVAEFLPKESEISFEEDAFIPIDSVFDEHTVKAILYLLANKNESTPGSFTAYKKHYKTDNPLRKQFESVLGLIPQTEKDNALAAFRQEIIEMIPDYQECKRYYIEKQLMLVKPSTFSGAVATPSGHDFSAVKEQFAEYRNKYSYACNWMSSSLHLMIENPLKSGYKGISEAMARIVSRTVKDPFKLCFAAVLMEEQSSDMFWCVNTSCKLLELACRELPWNSMDKGSVVFKHEGIDADDILYRNTYSYTKETVNGSQLFYGITGVVPPRNSSVYSEVASTEETIQAIFASAASLLVSDVKKGCPCEIIEFPEVETVVVKDEGLVAECASLQKQNSEAKQQLKNNKEYIHTLESDKKALEELCAENESEIERLSAELAELKTMIHFAAKDNPDTKISVSFPYEPKGKYVILGGHDSFIRTIKHLLPSVRILETQSRPNVEAALNVDTIWCQSNAISHSYFNTVLDKARTHSVPFEYFGYSSAEKCAEQLALYDMEQYGGVTDG